MQAQELIAAHKEVEAILTKDVVLTHAAHLDVVLFARGQRHRVDVLRDVVGDDDVLFGKVRDLFQKLWFRTLPTIKRPPAIWRIWRIRLEPDIWFSPLCGSFSRDVTSLSGA